MGLAFDQLFGKVSAGTDAVVRTEAAVHRSRRASAPAGRPIDASVLDQVRKRRRRPRRRGLGQRLRAADRQRRPGDHHQRWRARPTGYSMPADDELRGDVELLSGRRPDGPRRGRHRRHQRRGQRHRARLDDQGAVPGPDPGVHRRRHRRLRRRARTSAAPRRRTSTPRPRSRCSARPATFDAIDVSADDGVSPGRARRAAVRGRSRGHRGGHRRDRRRGERRRGQGGPQDRRDPVRDLRRHRAVRRLVHHLEHLHDDRHPALARDRAAAGDRCHAGAR